METFNLSSTLEPVKLMKEEDIVRIINECDILLLPDEDDEDEDFTVAVEVEEDFEAIYQQSKNTKNVS